MTADVVELSLDDALRIRRDLLFFKMSTALIDAALERAGHPQEPVVYPSSSCNQATAH